MERGNYVRTAALAPLAAAIAVAVWLVLLAGAARAAPDADAAPGYPAECGDPYIECGTGTGDSQTLTESWDAYEYAPGTCRTRWARATRRNLFWMVVFHYNEQVRWCWQNGVITYFWRDRWASGTAFSWSFDGHVGSNCIYEHCPGRGVGSYRTNAWTQGHFHACVPSYCVHKYPIVNIWVHGDGGSGANWSGA
jgi:hypothetical protein